MWYLKDETDKYIYRKQKQIQRYRGQTSDYQWGEGSGEGKIRDMGLRDTTTMCKIDKQQGYIIEQGIITIIL